MSEGVAIEILESDSPNEMTLNMGPQHPSTHGVFRLIMQLDGETVVGVKPVMGYLHRSTEKLGEARTYVQGVTLTDRMDYLSPMTTNWAYALTIEKLAGLEVPERAEYIRVIVSELSRIASHQVAIGTFGADVGTWFTPLVYCFREREEILDLFMLCAGVRMNPSYIRHGGVARDLSEEFLARCQTFIDKMPEKIDEYESLLTKNEIFMARTKGIGMLPPELCKEYSVTGPIARAQRHRLRHPPGRAVRHLRPLRLRGAGPLRRGRLRPLHGAGPGDARERQDRAAGAPRHPAGRHPGPDAEDPAPAEGRGVRPDRGAEGRDRVLPDLGRLDRRRTATRCARRATST